MPTVNYTHAFPVSICRLFVFRLIRDPRISTEHSISLSPVYTSVNLADDDALDLRSATALRVSVNPRPASTLTNLTQQRSASSIHTSPHHQAFCRGRITLKRWNQETWFVASAELPVELEQITKGNLLWKWHRSADGGEASAKHISPPEHYRNRNGRDICTPASEVPSYQRGERLRESKGALLVGIHYRMFPMISRHLQHTKL